MYNSDIRCDDVVCDTHLLEHAGIDDFGHRLLHFRHLHRIHSIHIRARLEQVLKHINGDVM